MPTDLRSGPSLRRAAATTGTGRPTGQDRRLTLRRHVDLGRCSSSVCTVG
ncbi:hypothetical protein ACIQU5_25730 [Streptomyces sp. NPDC090306]